MTSAKHYKLWCHKFNRIIKTFNVRIHKSDNLTKLEQCDVLLSSARTSDKRGLTPHRSIRTRAHNEGSRRFHDQGEGTKLGLLLVENANLHFHI